MSNKYILHYSHEGCQRDFAIEDFTDAIVCEGYVFLRDRVEHPINTDPGQCWGAYVDYPAGCFVNGEIQERGGSFCIDDPGDEHVITEIVSLEPLRIKTTRHIGVSYPAYGEERPPYQSRHVAELDRSFIPASTVDIHPYALVENFHGAEHTVLIPAHYNGMDTYHVDLSDADLSNVETLIISKGIAELAIEFSKAKKLRRLQIPDDVHLICPLDNISYTPWFKAQRPEPIYISDCYCGTPGGGSGQQSLIIPEGITSVAAGADFHSYWHSIKTPESLRSIGRMAFCTCHCLEELNFSEGLYSLGKEAFINLPRLKSLYLPVSLRIIGQGCFARAYYLQNVSVFHKEQAELFTVHSLTIRAAEGREEQHISKCPPFVITINDRISAFPPNGGFEAAGKYYRSTDELSVHPIKDFGFEYLDVHGRSLWRIAARDDCRYGIDGKRLLVERWFIETKAGITQIEKTVDGTVLVRDGISIHDVDFAVRNIAAREVFKLAE